MTKSYTWLWACLIILSVAGGCGMNPDAAYLYRLEKLFVEAERAGSAAGITPEAVTEADRIRIAEMYGNVVNYYESIRGELRGDSTSPEIQSALAIAVQSSLRMAALLAITGQSDRAVAIYNDLPREFPDAGGFRTVARFELARLFERNRQLDSSFATYHDLMYTYRPTSDTLSGYDLDWLRIPLHITEVYSNLDNRDQAAKWLDTAISFYPRLLTQFERGSVTTMARMYLATSYRRRGDYGEAIATYRTMTDSLGRVLPQAQVEIGNLFYEAFHMPDSALKTFKDLVAERPDDPAATVAQTKIAAIYIDQKKFQEARELLRPLKEAYEKKGQIVAGILLLLGRSYEAEGAWDRALNEYSWLTENFPELPQSMDIILHVISRMVQENNMSVARQWQRNSRARFEKTIAENPGTELAAMAQTSLARSYTIMQEWPEAAEAYRRLLEAYPPIPSRLQAYFELSSVYVDELEKPQEGAEILEKLLTDFPQFPRRAEIRERIDYLKSKAS